MQPASKNSLSISSNQDQVGKFLSLNASKIDRVRDNLTAKQRELLDVLALSFHTNDEALPAHLARTEGFGIVDFAPDERASRAAQGFDARFQPQKSPPLQCAIKGLYLMGSPGTVGYSRNSDLDIWLVHDPGLTDSQINDLNRKANKLEAYADSFELEMHFFVFDASRFRTGESLSLSAESSGSSQHFLLLDEFYRSGLLLAGLKPLWWHVPPTEESNYEAFTQDAIAQGLITTDGFVDFGGLAKVPVEEFFGAAVWQLYKSIDSPYKSVLKLLLMKTYASDYPNVDLLSHRYKKAVASGQNNVNDLDPYTLMYRAVEEYLIGTSDTARLELMRRCFYLKTNAGLTRARHTSVTDWQRDVLNKMTRSWKWTRDDLRHLDHREDWDVTFAKGERKVLIRALSKSYSALSSFARKYGHDQAITPGDLTVLGRKLYAAFERKASKIEITTRGICINPRESQLRLRRDESDDGSPIWRLLAASSRSTVETEALYEAPSVSGILAWCHFNGVADKKTVWHIEDKQSTLTVAAVEKSFATIERCFPARILLGPTADSFNDKPRPVAALFLVNMGIEPLADRFRTSVILTSNQTDAFQFGGMRINLVRSVDLMLLTTWGELYVYPHTGRGAAVEVVLSDLRWTAPLGSFRPSQAQVFALSTDHSVPITQRTEEFIEHMFSMWCEPPVDDCSNYIVQIDRSFFRIHAKNGAVRADPYTSVRHLQRELTTPEREFRC